MDPRVTKLTMLAVLAVGLGIGCSRQQSTAEEAKQTPSPETKALHGQLRVYAAKPYASSMAELTEMFRSKHPEVSFELHSGDVRHVVARMLEGERPDVLLSSGDIEVKPLEKAGLVGLRKDFCFITLGIITQKQNPASIGSLHDLAADSTRALAILPPDTSLGYYAINLLKKEKLWERIEPKVIVPDLPSQVLEIVAEGSADACLAYGAVLRRNADDAGQSLRARLKLVCDLTAQYCLKIPCPALSTSGCEHPQLAEAFIDFLTMDEAQEVLARYGFLRLRDPCCGDDVNGAQN